MEVSNNPIFKTLHHTGNVFFLDELPPTEHIVLWGPFSKSFFDLGMFGMFVEMIFREDGKYYAVKFMKKHEIIKLKQAIF